MQNVRGKLWKMLVILLKSEKTTCAPLNYLLYSHTMKRYTYNNLKSDVEILNAKLAEKGHNMRFMVGGRNGYTAIDLARVNEQGEKCGIQNTLETGTPRECLAACHEYMVHAM